MMLSVDGSTTDLDEVAGELQHRLERPDTALTLRAIRTTVAAVGGESPRRWPWDEAVSRQPIHRP